MLVVITAIFVVSASAQDTISTTYVHFPVVNDSVNKLQNVSALDLFFEGLHHQKEKNDRRISILHIGDSHIQGDYMTSIVRRRLQRVFGNAGRGLVVPFRVAGTNEPANFETSSTVTWTAKRCVHPAEPLPIGISGITVQTIAPETRLYVYMTDPAMDYRFNEDIIIAEPDSLSYGLRFKNTEYQEIAYPQTIAHTSPQILAAHLREQTDALVLETTKSNESQGRFTLYGLNLLNSKNGILYHAVGVNGAKSVHYNKAQYFISQSKILQPSLIIISLGTNESIEYPRIPKDVEKQLDSLVSNLIRANPYARILFTTPQANLLKGKPNAGAKTVRDIILKYAVDNGYAFWDWYQIARGIRYVKEWRTTGLLRSDGVHLTKEGFELQGHLLYHAIMKGYEDYVSHRHP